MSLRLEAMPDDPRVVALLFGPIVLAGDLGREGMDEARRYGPSAPQMGRVKPVIVPAFVGEVKDVLAKVKPAPGSPLVFETRGLGRPADVRLVPFYKAADNRYTVYWNVLSPEEWAKRKSERETAESRRREIERKTVDAVLVENEQSELDHGLKGESLSLGEFEGKRTRQARRGWFSYELKVLPDAPITLVCTYVGSEGRRRAFDILVDGEKIATQQLDIHPTELFDVEYALPEAATKGKSRVTVRFQALSDSTAGSVVEVRTVR
jgi:hypothetical protein